MVPREFLDPDTLQIMDDPGIITVLLENTLYNVHISVLFLFAICMGHPIITVAFPFKLWLNFAYRTVTAPDLRTYDRNSAIRCVPAMFLPPLRCTGMAAFNGIAL
jgi:hypothetical protein